MKKYARRRIFVEFFCYLKKMTYQNLINKRNQIKCCILFMPTLHFSFKNDNCKNSLEKSSTRKIGKNICCRYSMSIIWAFDHIGNSCSLPRRKDCMEKVL